MKPSNIGGQALIEGIMMRHGDDYAVAVRKPDQEIVVKKERFKSICPFSGVRKIPFLRGMIAFVDSMHVGYAAMMYSASFVEEEEALKTSEKKADEKKENQERFLMAAVFAGSFVLAICIFMLLPYFFISLLSGIVQKRWLLSLMEAVLRIIIFLVYLLMISRMKEIHRTFMYHGAEHKCINCIENGMDLTVENVLKSSRFHKRCGTNFMFIIVMITAVLLFFIQTDSRVLRIVLRLVLIPVIAGISYELLRFNGMHDNAVVNLFSKPGLALQRLTTKEPDAGMAEVAIASVEAVFDWKKYLKENFKEEK